MKKIFTVLVIFMAFLTLAGCGGQDITEENTGDITTPAPTPISSPTATPTAGPEETTGGLVVDPVGQDGWPSAFLQFPKYAGDGKLISSDVNEANTVMTRVYTDLTEYSIANYQSQLRLQDFVSNANADFLKSMDKVVLAWSYTVNGSTGEVTFIWKITTTEGQ